MVCKICFCSKFPDFRTFEEKKKMEKTGKYKTLCFSCKRKKKKSFIAVGKTLR